MRKTICASVLLLAVTAARSQAAAPSDAGQLIAETLPGQWVSESDREPLVTLDFFKHKQAIAGLDPRSSQSLEGRRLYLAGSMRDSRGSHDPFRRDRYAVVENDGPPALLIFPKTGGSERKEYFVRVIPGPTRQQDRLSLSETSGAGPWKEFVRVPESIRAATIAVEGPRDGVALTFRSDYASDLHTVLDSRLSWTTEDRRAKQEIVWKGLTAGMGAVSPDRRTAAIGMSEIASRTRDTEIVLVDLPSGKVTRTGLVAQGVAAMGSSNLPQPSVEWADERTVLFTAGRGTMFDRRIVLVAYDTESSKPVEFTDAATGKTALIEPGFGHGFTRSDDGKTFFRVGTADTVLYPLDVEKRTVGKAILIPRTQRPKSWKVLSREWLEKAGGTLR